MKKKKSIVMWADKGWNKKSIKRLKEAFCYWNASPYTQVKFYDFPSDCLGYHPVEICITIEEKGENMARGKGSCGGTRKKDGSGRGVGQKVKQNKKK